ncbi:hypothetical protein [Amycolatopsis sp. RTGN1]|uniref:hypothetical protein n=1 Tax=Amycolatopsis ponsaeliensis TaxID=2992142 RepID=UPI002551936B|nr:hypothetical protein [Amycolatopsis sp. RTGN1]
MTNDLHREDDPMPDAAEITAVYAALNSTFDALVTSLDQVLPVEQAISATIGPDSRLPKTPPQGRKARRFHRTRRWVRRPTTR